MGPISLVSQTEWSVLFLNLKEHYRSIMSGGRRGGGGGGFNGAVIGDKEKNHRTR